MSPSRDLRTRHLKSTQLISLKAQNPGLLWPLIIHQGDTVPARPSHQTSCKDWNKELTVCQGSRPRPYNTPAPHGVLPTSSQLPEEVTCPATLPSSAGGQEARSSGRAQLGVPGTRASSLTPLGPDTPPASSLSKAQRPLSQSGTVPCLSDPTSPKEAAGQTSKPAAGRGAQASSWGGCQFHKTGRSRRLQPAGRTGKRLSPRLGPGVLPPRGPEVLRPYSAAWSQVHTLPETTTWESGSQSPAVHTPNPGPATPKGGPSAAPLPALHQPGVFAATSSEPPARVRGSCPGQKLLPN